VKSRVLIVQKTIPQYRRRLYELLREALAEAGTELVLVYGDPEPDDASKRDLVDLDWAVKRPTRFVPVGRRRLYWQRCLALVPGVDLVVVEQASRLLVNYPLLALQMAGAKRVALWGHGRTLKATPSSRPGELAKAFMSRRAHWWFAYNELSAGYVREFGFPPERITVVENAIDTSALAAAGARVTDGDIESLRSRLGLEGTHVCLFVGALYREKRLPFLIAACELIKRRVPDFEMVFIGAGPDRHVVKEAAARNAWMRDVGPVFDADKAPYFRLAQLMLMPGGVGLAVLDAFALEVPMIATSVPYNGPECAYLMDGVNGIVLPERATPAAYAAVVADLLTDSARLDALKAGCREHAGLYTVENMARRFADGIAAALAS